MNHAAEMLALREELALLEQSESCYHDDPERKTQATEFLMKRRFEVLVRITELEEASSGVNQSKAGP